jgi:NADH:ubiquinone oxidoreductase subunit K
VAPLRAPPRNERELMISAINGHLLVFDNVSSLSQEMSDALCRLATGTSLAAAVDERAVGVNLVIDIRRKRTEANMITSPAWMLEGRTFAAATGAALTVVAH